MSFKDEQFEAHEAQCERCGRCCRIKVQLGGKWMLAGYCPMFDEKTKLCTVYENRFQSQKYCNTVLQSMMENALPEDCPYVRDFPGYKSMIEAFQVTKGDKPTKESAE